jgi:hypothetical protein
VLSAFPHTHLQGIVISTLLSIIYFFLYVGQSIWTKLIRNNTAVQYLFNAEAYNFNYQFTNRFPKGIQLYPVRKMIYSLNLMFCISEGDEFATRCVYNTMNKDEITLV